MIFYEERKGSCVECHSKLKTITTWENTCTLTITWVFMKSEKGHVMNVIQSWRPLRLEKTFARWPWHDFLWIAKKFVWWMSFKVEDHFDLRKHLHVDHNMIFLWRAKKFMWWMSFKVEDQYDLRKHLHVDHNMIFCEARKNLCVECHSELKITMAQ